MQRDVVHRHHNTMVVGHPGESKTLELLARNYWWPRMSQYVRHYVATCNVCGRTKNRPAIAAPLQPNEVPTKPWQIITADFIVGLPKSNGFDAIFVCCNMFTKMTHFVPCNDTVTVEQTVDLFQRHTFSKYGIPEQLIADRGPQFSSKLFRALFKTLGIKPTMSTAYHPQTDGQTERMNQELEQTLRAFINFRQDNWEDILSMKFSIGGRRYSATKRSPFHLMYGYEPTYRLDHNQQSLGPTSNECIALMK